MNDATTPKRTVDEASQPQQSQKGIYELEGFGTVVAFGDGRILVNRATDDLGQQIIYLSDLGRENPVGEQAADDDFASAQRRVTLGFNSVPSIQVLIDYLQEARRAMVESSPSMTVLEKDPIDEPIDPVFEDGPGEWRFWDETWAHSHGPYETEELAREALRKYGATL
jgi:hypothetical protein